MRRAEPRAAAERLDKMNMRSQVKRSMKVLRRSEEKDVIPHELIARAYGIVFMTTVKGAFLYSGTIGSGIFSTHLPVLTLSLAPPRADNLLARAFLAMARLWLPQ